MDVVVPRAKRGGMPRDALGEDCRDGWLVSQRALPAGFLRSLESSSPTRIDLCAAVALGDSRKV